MMDDIDKRLTEIKKREKSATPGSWNWRGKHGYYQGYLESEHRAKEVLYADGHEVEGIDIDDTDAEFIAHSRDDIPWLLELVADMRARLDAQGMTPKPVDDDEPVSGLG